MKPTGIVRRVDDLGRIVIPKELRRTYGIDVGDPMEIFTSSDGIVLRKYQPADGCRVCGTVTEDAVEVSGVPICRSCAERIAQQIGDSK
jgi:transcriptional pleiotropic regulator of transition state genes